LALHRLPVVFHAFGIFSGHQSTKKGLGNEAKPPVGMIRSLHDEVSAAGNHIG